MADVMRSFREPVTVSARAAGNGAAPDWPALLGPVTHRGDLQALFASESLAQALRQLVRNGRDGLPVLSDDGQVLRGWVTASRCLPPWRAR